MVAHTNSWRDSAMVASCNAAVHTVLTLQSVSVSCVTLLSARMLNNTTYTYINTTSMQGGFLLCKPDLLTFHALVDIVQEGNWAPGSGWGGNYNIIII